MNMHSCTSIKRLAIASAAALLAAACNTSQPRVAQTSVALAPGKIHEECRQLTAGDATPWQFVATDPLEFNVHYHAGNDVFYPLEPAVLQEGAGTFTAKTTQEYCWMWFNRSATNVVLRPLLAP